MGSVSWVIWLGPERNHGRSLKSVNLSQLSAQPEGEESTQKDQRDAMSLALKKEGGAHAPRDAGGLHKRKKARRHIFAERLEK